MMSRRATIFLAAASLTLLTAQACGGGAPPPKPAVEPTVAPEPAGPPTAEAVDTGKACVKAEGLCEGGVCTVEINNTCDAAVTCNLEIMALCRGTTTTGEARGKERDTFAAGESAKMQAQADCEGSAIAGTLLEALVCK